MPRDPYSRFGLNCPFCDTGLMPPVEITAGEGFSTEGGLCRTCGAVYIFDRSGRNLGSAYWDALVVLCDGDQEKAKQTSEEMTEEEVLVYNQRLNKFHPDHGRSSIKDPKLFFLRIKENV